jgi:DNA-binding response OmpR family regulator
LLFMARFRRQLSEHIIGEGVAMNRVLLIHRDPEISRALGMACIEGGIAVRMVENLCEGVRYMLHVPVSAILIEASLLRLAASDQSRLFELVAPGVPVVVMVPPSASTEERVRLEVQGFTVVSRPFDMAELLAKIEPLVRPMSRPGAESSVEALCR